LNFVVASGHSKAISSSSPYPRKSGLRKLSVSCLKAYAPCWRVVAAWTNVLEWQQAKRLYGSKVAEAMEGTYGKPAPRVPAKPKELKRVAKKRAPKKQSTAQVSKTTGPEGPPPGGPASVRQIANALGVSRKLARRVIAKERKLRLESWVR